MADFGIGETLLAASAAVGTVASVASAAGSAQAGKQQAQADVTNAAIQQENAKIATAQAGAQAAIDKTSTERTLGQEAAAYGGSGVDVTRGSPLQVMADQAATGELTRQLDLYRGAVAASGDTEQAQLLQQEGQNVQQAGLVRAGGTLLTGLAGAARSAAPLFGGLSPAASGGSSAAQSVLQYGY